MRQKLRIGLLMNSYELPFWEYILIERLINSYYASIELVVLNESKKSRKTLLNKIKDSWKKIIFILYVNLIKKGSR